VSDTDLKVLNKKKKYFLYPHLTEFLFSLLILIVFFFFLLPSNLFYLVTVFVVIVLAFLYYYILKVRKKEISEVTEVIKNIRLNLYTDPGDIRLGGNLSHLEEEIRGMLESMKRNIEYLRKLEKMRTEFLGNVSHELKTPIFTIQGYIETLLSGAVDDKEVSYKFLEKANHHTANLSNLVNDLINISMIESGEMKMSFRYFSINQFIMEVINEMIPLAEEKKLELTLSPARKNLLVYGDRTRLKQAMHNLVTNAVKYTDNGKVEIVIKEEENFAIIAVKDTGIGIAEPDKERIFERFYRIDKARSKSAGGTGLGLSIVKHIIEAHGSKIELNSRVNEGSEFFFKLKK
jgi:two-component system, OmpR family, phosphate regulon sensor histidine kinase PhoR